VRKSKSVLGSVIKDARNNSHLIQEELAERVHIGVRHLMAIENEGQIPSFKVLTNLIRELNIDSNDIFYPETHKSDEKLEYLIRLLHRCSENDIKSVTALVESMSTSTDS
jgi:DNA-binding XRE family transcriptional regulator